MSVKKALVFTLFFLTSVAQAAEVFVIKNSTLTPGEQHTRTLAASCAACHGTNGNAVAGNAPLAGIDATYFTEQMLVFKNGSRTSTVMHHHAKGLNADEINDLAVFFSSQTRVAVSTPKAQTLKVSHD